MLKGFPLDIKICFIPLSSPCVLGLLPNYFFIVLWLGQYFNHKPKTKVVTKLPFYKDTKLLGYIRTRLQNSSSIIIYFHVMLILGQRLQMVHNFLDIESKGAQRYQVTKKTTCLPSRQQKKRLKFCRFVTFKHNTKPKCWNMYLVEFSSMFYISIWISIYNNC